jgi:histidinol-phosphate aminotransferase
MNTYLDDRFAGLEEYTPGEQPKDQVYIKLNTNESPYPPGPATVAAVTDAAAAARLRLYSDPDSTALKKAIAGLYGLESSNVFVSNGSDDILNFAFMGFCQSGVLFPEISYGFYQVFAELHGTDFVRVPLKEGFVIDPEDYMGKKKAVVIANPNAPTGLTITMDDIRSIAGSNSGELVLIDEAYVDFGGTTAAALTREFDNLLVVQTFSKSRSLAGARLGFAIGSETLIGDLEKLKYSTNPYNVNSVTAAAGTAAIGENGYYMENCRRIAETRAWTTEKLTELGFQVLPSLANFIFVTSGAIDGEILYRKLKERKILVRHFSSEAISQYNRITIGTREEMEKLVEEIGAIIADGGKEQVR